MVEIPLRSDLPHFTVVVELDGSIYRLEFIWNTRESAYYMHMYDAEESIIQGSLKCVVGWPIGVLQCTDPRRPAGVLVFVDSANSERDPVWIDGKDLYRLDTVTRVPGYGELGDRVRLRYWTLADMQVVADGG